MNHEKQHFNNHDFNKAVIDFDEILEREPDNIEIQYFKALSLIEINEHKAAQDLLEQIESGPSVYAEKALYAEIQNILPVVQPLLAAKDYTTTLSKLAALRAPIDAFFDGVMVMADDAELKANRLRLLAQLRDLFTRVADVSVLQH